MKKGKDRPLLIGLRAARANVVPGLLVQAAMVAVVVGYYKYPPAAQWFALLAAAKARWGIGFSIFSGAVAGGLLPQLLKVATLQRGRVRREDWPELLFLVMYWGLDSTIVDGFYRLQAHVFGAQVDVPTVVKKVLVDQFIFNPVLAAPLGLFFYELKNRHYRWSGMSFVFTWAFYRDRAIPALVAVWGVWIPVTAAIYSLPPLLQIPLFALALTFWVLLFSYITAHHSEADAGADVKEVVIPTLP